MRGLAVLRRAVIGLHAKKANRRSPAHAGFAFNRRSAAGGIAA
ncbi:hypothetical protein C7S16_5000 [Burkholderia thailandensis]|uniref:Uncharacterized protein n=1 Tax=Burkholderia thailandensis TaxID=57975 RepID=A0AAW9CY96_BURTH|nr:hypothetical protein [Burkholderia thailandensis]MDW9252686.1 hypothetical protein [Burkholderia thailandensis]